MISRILALFAVLLLLVPAQAREWPSTGAAGDWPTPPESGAVSTMEPIDLSDGTWTKYDPATREVGAPSLITGTHKNRLNLTFGSATTGLATSILYYRPIRDADGDYPANVKGQAHRISVSWASRLEISASKQYILAAGYINGNPATAGTVIRLYGLQQSDGTGTQLTGRLATTAGAGTWSTSATAANPARSVSVMAQRLSIDGAIQVTPAIDTDGNGDTTNTVVNTYVFNEQRIMGAETTVYEAVMLGCANYELDGQVDTGAASGRTLQTAATQAAARAASVDAAGRDLLEREIGQPDVWLIMLGVNDVQAGRTKANLYTDLATEAAAVKGVFPAADVVVGCVYKTASVLTAYKDWCDELVAGPLPANVDAVWDYRPYWGSTDAFSVSGADGHPSVVASPTGLTAWNGPYSMNVAGAANSQCGTCMIAYHTYKFLRGYPPPLLAGEVAPE